MVKINFDQNKTLHNTHLEDNHYQGSQLGRPYNFWDKSSVLCDNRLVLGISIMPKLWTAPGWKRGYYFRVYGRERAGNLNNPTWHLMILFAWIKYGLKIDVSIKYKVYYAFKKNIPFRYSKNRVDFYLRLLYATLMVGNKRPIFITRVSTGFESKCSCLLSVNVYQGICVCWGSWFFAIVGKSTS